MPTTHGTHVALLGAPRSELHVPAFLSVETALETAAGQLESEAAIDLLQRLLRKDPNARIGVGPGGAEERYLIVE